MDSVNAVVKPGENEGAISQTEGAIKSPQILLIRIDFLWATKLERFVAVQCWYG